MRKPAGRAFVVIVLIVIAWPVAALDLLSLAPGTKRAEIVARLAKAHVEASKGERGSLVLDEPLLPDIFERQRTLLEFDGEGRLTSVHLRVVPESGATGDEVLRLYEDVKNRLLKLLGRPAWERREGDAAPDEILYALSNGDLVRVIQWEGPTTIRAGIPRRVDGEIAIEILITRDRISRTEEYWGAPEF